jgi:predicted secreted protein
MRKATVFTVMLTMLILIALAATLYDIHPMYSDKVEASANDNEARTGFFPDGVPPPTEWNKTYGGTGWDVANSVVETGDGGFLLAGYNNSSGAGKGDFWMVRTNSAGRMLWNRTSGGPDYDEAQSVIQTVDGGYAVAGVTRSYGLGVTDFWLVKTDLNGLHQWNRTYGGTGLDYLFALTQTNDGGYVMTGSTYRNETNQSDFYLVKTDSAGNLVWERTYGESGWEEAYAVVQTSDGGYAVVGETDSVGAGGTDIWWVKTTPDGDQEREQTYGGANNDGASSLVQTADGGYLIAGYTESYGNGIPMYPDLWLVRIDSTGKARPLWDHSFGGLGSDSAEDLISTESGFAVAGATQLYNASDQDFWLITTDTVGNLNWSQTYGGSGYDHSYSAIETVDRGFALVGDTFSYGAGSADMWLVKVEGSIPRHNVAVIDVAPSKTVVGQGYSLSVNVTVENLGNRAEAINASVYANTTIVDTLATMEIVTPGSVITIVFIWDTVGGGFLNGGYAISADAVIAPPTVDFDPTDNSLTDGMVYVSGPGDVDASGIVNAFDLFALGKAYASLLGNPSWNANCDVDSNGAVDLSDLSLISDNYGRSI